MDDLELVYQDRLLKITKFPTEKGYRYKIEATYGRFFRCWEGYFTSDEQAIDSAKREFKNLYK
jgi:hypothetical protein